MMKVVRTVGQLGGGRELGGADRGEILGMREQDGIAVADPVVKVDLAFGGVGGEVGGGVIDAQCHGLGLSCRWELCSLDTF
ncbi:hypothetical protein Ga0609869_001471 [Rhodovulum iodosum]|uniref:Uncharacterized protein n=1 Tax=Rhodovulum iodosum TaxID=68291 RepID=A0ABV3XS17_9RHOB